MRRIAYLSTAAVDWPRPAIADLVGRAQAKNASLGVTGRLFLFENRFLQILDGDPPAVGGIYDAILADVRHRDIVELTDRPIAERAFPDWSLHFADAEDLIQTDRAALEIALDRLDSVRAGFAGRGLGDLAAGPVGALISAAMRARPLQERSLDTVERLLAAGEAIFRRTERLHGHTIDAVAVQAACTRQAAYRYFRDIDDLIRVMMRREQAVELERLLAVMTETRFETEADLAAAAAAFFCQAAQRSLTWPTALRDRLLRDYHFIAYDHLWMVAEAAHAAMARRGDPCGIVLAAPLAIGFAAAAAAAKSMLLRDPQLLADPAAAAIVARALLGALGGAGGGRLRAGAPAFQGNPRVGLAPPLPPRL